MIRTKMLPMKTLLSLVLISPALLFSPGSFSQNLFSKTYGGAGDDIFHAGALTADSGYILTGLGKSYGDTSGNAFIIKTDRNGNMQFVKNYGGSKLDGGNALQQTNDGGYIIAGHTQSYSNDCDGLVIKLDANGDSLWGRIFGNPDDDALSAVEQTTDGGFIFAGYSENYSARVIDVYLIKTDQYGSIQWQKFIGGDSVQVATAIRQTGDGGFIIAGRTRRSGNDDVFLLRTDANGDSLWSNSFGGSNDDKAYGVQITTDGGFIIAGTTLSYGAGSVDYYLLKTDANGNLQWQRTFGGSNADGASDVKQTQDGGFIITGTAKSFGDTLNDIYLVKTDASGNYQWGKKIGGNGDDASVSVLLPPGGGYAVAGYTACFGNGGYDGILVRTDSAGNNVTGVGEVNDLSENVKLFPNPSNDLIQISAGSMGEAQLNITDVSGKKIRTFQTDLSQYKSCTIELYGLDPGIYFLSGEGATGRFVKKFIVIE